MQALKTAPHGRLPSIPIFLQKEARSLICLKVVKKTTSSNTCSIRGSYGALLAPYARLVSSGKQDCSKACKVTQSVSHPALFSTASKGSTFYTKVSTSNIDPGYIEVTLQFSADHID